MKLLEGNILKEEILNDLKDKVLDKKIGLTVILIGNNPASEVYVGQKKKMAERLGYNFNLIRLDDEVSESYVIDIINTLNNDDKVDGILIQMPISNNLNASRLQNAIIPSKDVDGLTDINMGKLVHNSASLIACTALGIVKLLDHYNISIEGANVVILGRSPLVGKPLFSLLTNRNATVTLCHSKTKNLSFYTKNADILVAAIGKANFVNGDMIKEGAVIIDVGINRLDDGSLCGDVDFASTKDKASYISPVPGGVGPMTIASLALNTYKAHCIRRDNM